MRRLPILATAFAALFAVGLYAAEEIKLDEVKCIMNPKAAAKAEKFVEFKEGKVFFCCENCPKGFAAKVEAEDKVVIAKGNHQLIQTGQAKQVKCPFTGGPLKTELVVAGAKIQFCCNNCLGKAKGLEGEEQIVALFGDDAFKKAEFKVGEGEKKGVEKDKE
ncbi:MAG: hypothetical protein KF861_10790 [Planctomycetaceae bacterium]|nr:hypothetical protein [Planctomycetaceae bacterium]